MKRYLTFIIFAFISFQTPIYASFAVYYGSNIDGLSEFNLLILSPLLEENHVKELKAKNITVVGYLSLATIGGWEPWAKDVPKDLIIGKNQNWDEKVVDFSSPEWKHIILDEAIPYILSRGFDGVFLDNLDYVDQYPDKKEGMVDLVKAIRERYPNITIIANRGFSIADGVAPYVDHVLFEDFVTYYNFSSGRYAVFDENDLQWEFDQVKRLRSLNVSILALSYANLTDESQVREFSKLICRYAKEYNISEIYLAGVDLQKVGFDPCGNTTGTGEENKGAICGPAFFLPLILLVRFILR